MIKRTELKDYQRELYYFRARLGVGAGIASLLFFFLSVRFFYLQVIEHDRYQTMAENNRIAVVPIPPNRGLILDRNGVILASNFSAYKLEITPNRVRDMDATITILSSLVDITKKDHKQFKKLLAESHDFVNLPIRTRLSDEEVARVAVNLYRLPGVSIRARSFRYYPKGEVFAHVVGYIGRINEKDMENLQTSGELDNYRGTDYIGKVGLERKYQRHLHGTTGFDQVETDSLGRAVRSLDHSPPVSGDTLNLTLDSRLQEVAEEVFGNYRGALVAIEPQSGEILAFLSKPGFDPNLFVEGIDPVMWESLTASPDKPLNNRAIRGQYPPGSTIKPFVALAALELNKRRPQTTIVDAGFYMLPNSSHRYRDWKEGGHGAVDMHKAIVESCDTYFYGLAADLGITHLHDFLAYLGFGRPTGIDIEGEVGGLIPSVEWKQERFHQQWFAWETLITGIGQGYTLTTPLQLAYATTVLANGGWAHAPHLVKSIQDGQTNTIRPVRLPQGYKLELKPENLRIIHDAMMDVTRPGGTAAGTGLNSPYLIAGKTGTAQVIGIKQNEKYVESRVKEYHRDHSWFIAYAPADNPKIAIAVLVENGGHGSTTAAPIARKIMDFYLLGKLPQPGAALKDTAED